MSDENSRNTEEVQIYNPTEDDLTARQAILRSIANSEPDAELLENLKRNLTLNQRIERLEMEMEKRVKENAMLTLNFATVMNHLSPMVKKIFNHFFE
jgi:hypothetical protein